MGIKGLTKFISDQAPRAIRQQEIGYLGDRIVAIDASMTLYQFMTALRDAESYGTLTNSAGEATSHISGFLSRVVRLLENNIKPIYVFDGKPPTLKSGELAKRTERREKAEAELKDAKEEGDEEKIKKFTSRTVKITKQHNEDIKYLLKLLGCPVVEAPCEAEAQCADLCKRGLAYGTATEDADALCFGTPFLLRHLNFSESKAKENPLLVIELAAALVDLELSMEQFIDFCILCGCDYTETIHGIGPSTAYKLIKQHKCIENLLENLDGKKYPIPVPFPFNEARSFFQNPEIMSETPTLEWGSPDFEGLRKFLIDDNDFNPTRVENMITRMKKVAQGGSQKRLDSFFKVTKSTASVSTPKGKKEAGAKRPLAGKAAKQGKKQKTGN